MSRVARIPLLACGIAVGWTASALGQDRYVTWLADGDAITSTWLHVDDTTDDATEPRVIAHREGLWLDTVDGLWSVQPVSRPGREFDCACPGWDEFVEPPESCIHEVPVVSPGIVHLEDGFDLRASLEANELTTWGHAERTWSVRGTAGPLLLLEHCLDETACGAAHPTTTCRFEVWNLALRTRSSLETIFDGGRVPDDLYDRALIAFEARDEIELEPGEVHPTAARLAWDADGQLRLFVQFTRPSSYADSDGSWSSYSRSLELEADLPELLRAQRRAPSHVVSFWADRAPQDAVRGWTRGPH